VGSSDVSAEIWSCGVPLRTGPWRKSPVPIFAAGPCGTNLMRFGRRPYYHCCASNATAHYPWYPHHRYLFLRLWALIKWLTQLVRLGHIMDLLAGILAYAVRNGLLVWLTRAPPCPDPVPCPSCHCQATCGRDGAAITLPSAQEVSGPPLLFGDLYVFARGACRSILLSATFSFGIA